MLSEAVRYGSDSRNLSRALFTLYTSCLFQPPLRAAEDELGGAAANDALRKGVAR
jgi:hypothetical protein